MRVGAGDIVRINRRPEPDGLWHWELFGLNLLDYNYVSCPIHERPDVVFLRDLTERLPCAAHLDGEVLWNTTDGIDVAFGPPDGVLPYVRTRVGYSDQEFYELHPQVEEAACFLRRVTADLWRVLFEQDAVEQLMTCHGLVLCLAPRPEADGVMAGLLAAPFGGSVAWMRELTRAYGAVVGVGHDGQYLHVWADREGGLSLIEPSLQAVTAEVERTEWFQAHRHELRWSDDTECCLMLPGVKGP